MYGYEYQPGFDDSAYISWVSDNKLAWTTKAGGFAADPRVNISARPIPQEPMVRALTLTKGSAGANNLSQYIIMNFAMSTNFATVEEALLPFPSTMLIDYVRVYQRKGSKNIGCDPPDFPTADYINT